MLASLVGRISGRAQQRNSVRPPFNLQREFSVTRALISQLPDWLHQVIIALPAPVRVPEDDGNFHWEFPEKSPRVLMAAKAVRMVSGIRAALSLVDAGQVTESATLLRTVSDFAGEILAIGEGEMTGRPTAAQRAFVEEFFTARPMTLEDFKAREKAAYVNREELIKAHVRLASNASVDGELLRDLRRFLNMGYDSYVHGAYLTAMELYDAYKGRFQVEGNLWPPRLCIGRVAVAGKLHEVLTALEFMAFLNKNVSAHDALRDARRKLEATDEQSNTGC